MQCSDSHLGVPCIAEVTFCKCKSDAVVLTELGYWPATPSRPNLDFSFSFFDWMEALLLEAQVATQDYRTAVEFILKERIFEVCFMWTLCLLLIMHCTWPSQVSISCFIVLMIELISMLGFRFRVTFILLLLIHLRSNGKFLLFIIPYAWYIWR